MSIYSVATLGTSSNKITFNDYSSNPVYRIKTRAPQQFQVREDDIPIPFESGISDFKTLIGKTLYILQGTMYPRDETSYDAGLAALRKACYLDTLQSDIESDLGYVPYTWADAAESKTIFVKPIYVKLVEDTRQGFVQPFVIYCKVKDPMIYGAALKQANTGAASTTGGGSAKYPFTYPVLYGATTYSVTTIATNIGNVPVYPTTIEVYGPITNPKITNQYTGQYMQVNVTLSSGSDYLNVQYDKDTYSATLNGNSVLNNIASGSTPFKIQPGSNPITLDGTSVGTGAYAIVSFRDGYALA